MGKTVSEKSLRIIFSLREAGDDPVKIDCVANYDVSAEGLSEVRSIDPTFTTAQESTIRDLGDSILAQIKTREDV